MLKVENIRKVFWTKSKKTNVLEGISFNMRKGECTALIGESGCGKTTLARIILGLIKSDGGTIFVSKGGDNQSKLRLGVVFKNPCLCTTAEPTLLWFVRKTINSK